MFLSTANRFTLRSSSANVNPWNESTAHTCRPSGCSNPRDASTVAARMHSPPLYVPVSMKSPGTPSATTLARQVTTFLKRSVDAIVRRCSLPPCEILLIMAEGKPAALPLQHERIFSFEQHSAMKLAAVAAMLEGAREWAGRERMEVMVLGTSLAESLASWLAFDSTCIDKAFCGARLLDCSSSEMCRLVLCSFTKVWSTFFSSALILLQAHPQKIAGNNRTAVMPRTMGNERILKMLCIPTILAETTLTFASSVSP
mmetsp:Transcript_20714/g.39370  ORF Transcript_20714/g.39370 Transcript_20714/m.39370 type:complete len:257 (-) Transcript_20714:218-988(-)